MSVNNISLTNIDAINLLNGDIGGQLNERLGSIQTNFQSIVNQNYLKGCQGESIVTQAVKLEENGALLNTFVNLICANLPGEVSYQTTQKDRVRQNIIDKEIVIIKGTNEDTYMSAIPFVYKDNTDSTNISNPEDYLDLSCILYYDHIEDAWKKINTFPTIYFDNEIQKYCWNINGVKTQLPAEGVPGPIGLKGSSMILAETNSIDGTANAIIKKIFITGEEKDSQGIIKYVGKWVDVDSKESEDIQKINSMSLRDDCAVLLHYKDQENEASRWLFANLKIIILDDGSLQYQAITDPSGELSLASIFAQAEGYVTQSFLKTEIDETEKELQKAIDDNIKGLENRINNALNDKAGIDDIEDQVVAALGRQIDSKTGIFSIRPKYWNWGEGLDASNNKCYLAGDPKVTNEYGSANPYTINMPSIAQETMDEGSTVQTFSVIFKVIIPRYYKGEGNTTYETGWNRFTLKQTSGIDIYITGGNMPASAQQIPSSNTIKPSDKFELVFTGYCFQTGDSTYKSIWLLDSTLLNKK